MKRFGFGRSVAGPLLVPLLVMVLAGCGFQPLMARRDDSRVQEAFAQIKVAVIADRSGQILRNYLLDDLNPRGAQGPERYTLRVILSEPRREVAISRDSTANVVAYGASVSFSLSDNRSRMPNFTGNSSSQSTYVVTNSEYATLSSFNAARDRVLQDVSADIRQQIAAYLLQQSP